MRNLAEPPLANPNKLASYNQKQGVFSHLVSIFEHIIVLDISICSAHLLVLGGVQVSNLVPVQQKPCNAVLDKQNSQGYDCNQAQTTSGRCASNYSRRLLACIRIYMEGRQKNV